MHCKFVFGLICEGNSTIERQKESELVLYNQKHAAMKIGHL